MKEKEGVTATSFQSRCLSFANFVLSCGQRKRDCGHCGNHFNMLWGMPSVALSGPNATGAWMKEFGTWYFDLARRWDGSYPHQGPPENEEDSFVGFDATGTYLLAYAIRVEGLRVFAKHRIAEGIQACVRYTRQQNPGENQLRTPELMKILLSYGTHAKVVIPELTEIANYFEKDEPDFTEELMKQKAKSIRNTILAIEATTETPELDRLR